LKSNVEVTAPGKLMLFGEHAVVYDRPCIVSAVDQRVHTEINLLSGGKIIINAPDVGVTNYESTLSHIGKNNNLPKGVRFVEQAIITFTDEYHLTNGIRVETRNDFSAEFGFGSSSAVTVGTIAGLSELMKIKMSKKQLFNLCYKTILKVQGVGSGFDIAAAIWGGTIYFVTGGKVIKPLNVGDLPIVVGYTGVKADTPSLVRKVADIRSKRFESVEKIFDDIAKIVKKSKELVSKREFEELGKLMNENQALLKKLSVSSNRLDRLIDASRQAGAYGAKLSGAGGGDCMIALCSEDRMKDVEAAINITGGKVVDVKFDSEGLKMHSRL
jgi:mevalonate kinase